MQFFTEATLPLLEGHLDKELQSILFEVLFWTILYLAYVNVGSRLLRSWYRTTRIWTLAHLREGVLCGNGRDDAVLLTLVGIHHCTAGALMWLGLRNQNPDLWRHGFLLEVGFEVSDLLSMIVPMYPYRLDQMKTDATIGMAFHHLPGIMLSPFVMSSGLYRNVHLQAIGLWLLTGAAASCVFVVILYTLDYSRRMGIVATLFCLSAAFFVYARWYVYPTEALALLDDVANDPTFGEGTANAFMLSVLKIAGLMLAVFNLLITLDVVPKTVRYVSRALDGGKTPIETKPIPSSRDSIVFGRARKRSSLVTMGSLAVIDPLEFSEYKKLE